jgi:hypothetical protein
MRLGRRADGVGFNELVGLELEGEGRKAVWME